MTDYSKMTKPELIRRLQGLEAAASQAADFSGRGAASDGEGSDRSSIEQAIRNSERKFRALFNQTFQFVGLLEPDGTVLEANQTALDFRGIKLPDVVGRPFWETPWWDISAEAQDRLKAAIARAAQGEFVRYEVDLLGANGAVCTFDFSLKPVFDENQRVVLLIPEGRDITKRREVERTLRKIRVELEQRVEQRTSELATANAALQSEIGRYDRAARALQESEQRLRAILETAVEAIITIDERGNIDSINSAGESLFGYKAEELVGRNLSMLMPSPFREKHDQYLETYRRTGHAKIIGIGRETVAQRKNGTVFPIDLAVSEVQFAHRRLFTGFVRDITVRKRFEQHQRLLYANTRALAESNTLAEAAPRILAAICETAAWDIGEFWSVDRDAGVLRYIETGNSPSIEAPEFNSQARQTTFARGIGLPGQVWAGGKPVWVSDVIQSPNFARAAAARKYQLHGAFAFPVLLGRDVLGVLAFYSREIRQPDPELIELFVEMGSQIGQFIERKRAEGKLAGLARTLAEKNKELETIVYVASHDLRSPLVNVQGFSRELGHACERIRNLLGSDSPATHTHELQGILSIEIPEALEFIEAGVAKMDALLSGFLRFSRLGRAALKIERLNMNALVHGIAHAMEFQLKQAGASLRMEALPDCVGDATQMNQVFSNLLDNAVKYLDPARPGVITVFGRSEDDRSIFGVQDNGIGIAPEHQSKAFEIFHRLNPTAGSGEGLGLTIAQKILERHDGKIWMESEPGKGSTFLISLPNKPKAIERK